MKVSSDVGNVISHKTEILKNGKYNFCNVYDEENGHASCRQVAFRKVGEGKNENIIMVNATS